MALVLPGNVRTVLSIGVDFDAHSVWMATFGQTGPSYLSRGEFDAKVGVPRLLDLFAQRQIAATWFIPGHTLETFPEEAQRVRDQGHEIAAHGCYHEKLSELSAGQERELLVRQLEQHSRLIGSRPRGYRSPGWDHTRQTLTLLEEFGFAWDSSLMGRDFTPYRPRHIASLSLDAGNKYGDTSTLLEFPVSWYLDDFPAAEFIPGESAGLTSPSVLYETWKDHFDFALNRVSQGVVNLTVHPQSIGRAHYLLMFERFLDYVGSHEGVSFQTLSMLERQWEDEGARD